MRSIIVVMIISIFLLSCQSIIVYETSRAPSERDEFPWLVAFFNAKNNFFCAGSLISDQHVLSVAHCFQDKGVQTIKSPDQVTALLGKYNLTDTEEIGFEMSLVAEIIIHPDWENYGDSYDADISVVKLSQKINFTEFIKPVNLPSEILQTMNGTVVGWGMDDQLMQEEIPTKLDVPAINATYCYTRYPKLLDFASPRMFCVGYEDQGIGRCKGDSGGGFYYLNQTTGEFEIRGIVSSGLINERRMCDVNTFSHFTNVRWFVGWINDVMKRK